jgi:cytochrome c peroxidase
VRTISTFLLLGIATACRPEPGGEALHCRPSAGKPGSQICEAAAQIEETPQAPSFEDLNPRLLRRFKPLRASFFEGAQGSPALVDLGRMLYYDARLSKTGRVSCNTCHLLDQYGANPEARAAGVTGRHSTRNAPSTYNAAAGFTQFWDGRSPDVETQALSPLLDPLEMGMTAKTVVDVLSSIRGYADPFREAFPNDPHPIALKNVGAAIGAFERTLATPSRWDRYLSGERAALSDKEKEGLRVFTSVGCMVCHTGELVGGSMYEKLGAAAPWPTAGGSDHGRAGVTGNASDEMVFKVPSLRNVARTAPYFHDGSVQTLPEAVRLMGTYQLGETLSDAEVESVVAWLSSLTAELPASAMHPPHLPEVKQ